MPYSFEQIVYQEGEALKEQLSDHCPIAIELEARWTVDPDLDTVIRQALADAQAAGRDYLTQTELAVRAVLQVRLDMTASNALTVAELVRRE